MPGQESAPRRPGSCRADGLAATGFATVWLSSNVSYWTLPKNAYYLRGENREGILALFLAALIVAAGTYGLLRWARRSERARRAALALAVPATLVALGSFLSTVGIDANSVAVWGIPALAGTVFALRSPDRASRAIHAGFRWAVALSVLYGATLVDALVRRPRFDPQTEGGPPTRRPIVIWAVFDELDEGWLFDHRPKDLALPAFDALAARSLVCTQAQRPGPETLYSLPALTVGKPVVQAEVASSRDVALRFEDGTRSAWSRADTIFDAMLRRGRTPAINGFYHNYPGVFAGKVGQIRTWRYVGGGFRSSLEFNLLYPLPVPIRARLAAALTRKAGPLLVMLREGAQRHRERIEAQVASMERTLRSRSADFLLFHCRVPHNPYIQEYRSRRPGLVTEPDGYFGNLQVADEVLADLVRTLRETGAWKGATLLVTSDHNLRATVRNEPLNTLVPLILKLPGQARGTRFDEPVNGVDERWLLEAIEAGRVRDYPDAAAFLARRRGPRPPAAGRR